MHFPCFCLGTCYVQVEKVHKDVNFCEHRETLIFPKIHSHEKYRLVAALDYLI